MKANNRSVLRFESSAPKYFAFLEQEGLSCVLAEPTFVRFESSSLFINIYHGRSSYEIGLEIGRLGNSEEEKQPYPMSALLGITEFRGAKEYRDYATHTIAGVNEGLKQLAELFRTHVSAHIKETNFYQRLKEQRRAWSRELAQEVKLQQMRSQLEIAWKDKDYKAVVELLYPIQEALTLVERRKLEYAQEHIQRTNRGSRREWR